MERPRRYLRFTIYDLRFANCDLQSWVIGFRKSHIVNRKWRGLFWGAILFVLLFYGEFSGAQQRFPPPDFEGGHRLPTTETPAARNMWFQYADVAVLAVCLGVASWLIYRKRSRTGVLGLSIFSLLYFGFWRKGCVCAIGSLQNVSLALFEPSYGLPVTVLAFFICPIAVALFFGRSFCAAVCPHGALQDLVLLKPIKVPQWLEQGLSILPFVYLGAGVLFAATGSAFIICEYDPFVSVFRMSGRSLMVLTGVGLVVLGVFVGRPYCRFLCPYGALLKMGATVARWRVRITPNLCTQCRLCQNSCPLGALRAPQAAATESTTVDKDRRRLAILLALMPVLIATGAWVGGKFGLAAARIDPTIALTERYLSELNAPFKTGALSPEELALGRAREHPNDLLHEAKAIQHRIQTGSWVFGAWVGAVVSIKLISLGIYRRRQDYEPSAGECFACARCFEFCPNERVRRGIHVRAAANCAEASALQTTPQQP